MIAVMTAYKEGKVIQSARKGSNYWMDIVESYWDWNTFEYRIKPVQEIRPYANAEEFLAAQEEHGLYIYYEGNYCMPDYIGDKYILLKDTILKFEDMTTLKWQDGVLCGIF